jgi:hypothetical protein
VGASFVCRRLILKTRSVTIEGEARTSSCFAIRTLICRCGRNGKGTAPRRATWSEWAAPAQLAGKVDRETLKPAITWSSLAARDATPRTIAFACSHSVVPRMRTLGGMDLGLLPEESFK